MNTLFLGYGKMGQALGNAWLNNQLISTLVAVDPMLDAQQENYFNRQQDVPDQAFDLVILAVKPNLAKEVLQQLKPAWIEKASIISIMAGVSTSTLQAHLNQEHIPVIRVMPNTPVLAQAGCCILYTSAQLSNELKAKIEGLFSAVGYADWLEHEDDLHAVTALSGSGPAYIHLFTEALQDAGIKLGLSPNLANALAKQTAYGASLLQNEANTDVVELRKNVTSPNGTTHAAIETFEKDQQLRQLVEQALQAALNRSIELSQV